MKDFFLAVKRKSSTKLIDNHYHRGGGIESMEKFHFVIQRFSWATITSAGKSTVVSDSVTTAKGTNNADTITTSIIENATRTINGNAGNDYVKICDASDDYAINYSKVTVNGGAGNDTIDIRGSMWGILDSTLSVNGGTGADVISIVDIDRFSQVTIVAGAGDNINVGPNYGTADYLFDSTSNVTISGITFKSSKANTSANIKNSDNVMTVGTGFSGTISIPADKVVVDSYDNIISTAGLYSVVSGKFNAPASVMCVTKYNTVNGASIVGTSGTDSIFNVGGSNIKISVGSGNDTIYNIFSENVTISGGNGDDYIYSSGSNVTISGDDGNDLILSGADNVIISGDEGNDFIESAGYNVTIDGGEGNDSIGNKGANTYIDGGAGADNITIIGADKITIESAATKNTVKGGTGNDTIYSSVTGGVLYSYAKGDGHDVIKGWTAKDTLSITGGAYKTSTTGNNVLVSITGGEKITLANAKGKKININPSGGKNINNTKASTLVAGTAYADTLKNSASKVTIQGNAGADKISLTSAAKNNVIIGGEGNDSIYSSVTSGVLFKYAKGDGNDYIKGWTAKDTLSITGGAYKLSTVGNDVKVSIAGGNFITLVGAKGKTSNIKGSSSSSMVSSSGKNIDNSKASTLISGTAYADKIKNTASKVTISGGAGNDSINNSGASLQASGGDGNDTIRNSGVNSYIHGGAGADKITVTSAAAKNTIVGGSGNDSINNSGANAYIEGGAGADKITLTSTASKNTIKGGTGNDSIYSSVTSGVLYKYVKGDGNDYIKGWTAKDTLSISGGAYKLSTVGNDVKVSIAGGSFITLAGAKGKTINVKSSSSTSKLIGDSDVSSLILFDDDNFVTDSAQIDSVTELSDTNYSVGKVTSLQGYDVFAQDSLPVSTSYAEK